MAGPLTGDAGRSWVGPRERLHAVVAGPGGPSLDRLAAPGTTVVPDRGRAGTGRATVFAVGRHTVVRCDPAVADRVAPLSDPAVAYPVDQVAGWAAANGGRFVGGARLHVVGDRPLRSPPTPPGAVRLDSGHVRWASLVEGLVGACSVEDVEAADLDSGSPFPWAVGLADPEGGLAAYAGCGPWEAAEEFDDIGVLVRPGVRRGGWGAAVVGALCEGIVERAGWPLYRCNWEREASRRLAVSIGFEETASLAAVDFGGPGA